jgi:anti-sigma regulatory factor (Ser/Thr protein kinase)
MSSGSFDGARVFDAKLAQLDTIQAWVNSLLEANECPTGISLQISVIIEELFVNIVSYAYEGKAGEVTLRIAIDNSMFRMQFEDYGKPFIPLEHPLLDTKEPLGKRRIGGMGIYIVRKTVDKIEYRREQGRNILTLYKRIKEEFS